MNRLGKYQIRRTLGKGAMGIVYEGFDPAIERRVAIKTILPAQLQGAHQAALMARFKREAQAAGRLNHPGIVAVYDYGEDIAEESTDDEATRVSGTPQAAPQRVAYIAMEFVKGRELKELLDGGQRMALPDATRLMDELLDALDHAHAHGVVHRDIKPANLIVLDSGRLKVADFGIARIEASELTQAGTVMGTPYYMSPEQFTGQPVDGRSDLFSCGVLLYQLLTGEKPFTGETSNTVMYKVLREEPLPPSALNVTLPPALDAVVHKALAKNPAQRFQTAHEFAAALQSAAAGDADAQTVVRRKPDQAPTLHFADAPTGPAPLAAAPVQAPAAAPSPSRAGLWVALSVAGVAAAAAGALFLGPGRHADPRPAAAQADNTAPVAAAPTATAPVPAPAEPSIAEQGLTVVSAWAAVDPKDAQFKGDAAAAQAELREQARRKLMEKALGLYVDRASLDANWPVLEKKLIPQADSYIRRVLLSAEPAPGLAGTIETQARAVLDLRGLSKTLNALSREERIDLIRNQGDPRISVQIDIASAGGAMLPRERSLLAENVVKERLRSFGFRTWSAEGEAQATQRPDFAVRGEVKLKELSAKLAASGLTITRTAITSWTIKAIDTTTGEEVYLSTKLPAGKSWGSEDQALAEIGKLVGEEFSRSFFLQNHRYQPQRIVLTATGLPDGAAPLLLRELRGLDGVLDATVEGSGIVVQVPEGDAAGVLKQALLKPLNARLGAECLQLASAGDGKAQLAVAPACGTDLKARLESATPPKAGAPRVRAAT